MVSLACTLLIALLVLPGCDSAKTDYTAKQLGAGAFKHGLFDDKSAAECVGNLIRHADMDTDTFEAVVSGSGPIIGGEHDAGAFESDVEYRMKKECGVEPWPGVDNWPGDPNRD